MSNVTLNTAVYVGEGIQNGIVRFINRTAGLLSGFSSLLGRILDGPKYVTIRWNLAVPVLVEADSSCACAGDPKWITYVEVQVKTSRKADAAHRLDIRDRITGLVASTPFADSITNLTLTP